MLTPPNRKSVFKCFYQKKKRMTVEGVKPNQVDHGHHQKNVVINSITLSTNKNKNNFHFFKLIFYTFILLKVLIKAIFRDFHNKRNLI